MFETIMLFAKFSPQGWVNGAVFGALIGGFIGIVYKACFGGPGRQA